MWFVSVPYTEYQTQYVVRKYFVAVDVLQYIVIQQESGNYECFYTQLE